MNKKVSYAHQYLSRTESYYKCHSAKNKKGCTKKAVKKEWIEDLVVEQTMAIVMNDNLLERITSTLLQLQGEDNYDLKLLQKQLNETEKGIENMLNAIQAGIITASTKQRLSSLEEEKESLEQRITEARIQHPILTREQIRFFLDQFRCSDINDEDTRQRLIDSFVNAVYVYDDKIIFVFNYRDGTKTVRLSDLKSSDLERSGSPKRKTRFACLSFFAILC